MVPTLGAILRQDTSFFTLFNSITQQQCELSYKEQRRNRQTPKKLTPWRDSNPRSSVPVAETITTTPRLAVGAILM
jgi:hypothetical protein